MVVCSPFPDQHIDDRPVHIVLLEAMQRHAQRTCLIDGVTGASQTFSEVRASCYGVASALAALGIGADDVVSMSLPNCNEYLPLNIGILMVGATASLLNPAYQEYELEHYISDSGSCAVVCAPDQLDAFCATAAKCKTLNTIAVLGAFDVVAYRRRHPSLRFVRVVEDVLSTRADLGQRLPTVDTRTDAAFLLYSSGTTGLPKAVVHSHYTLAAAIASIKSRAWYMWPDKDDHYLSFLPYFHIYGLIMWLILMPDGVALVSIKRFEPKLFLEVVEKYRVRMLYVVPPVMVFLSKHPLVDKYDLSCVEALLVGAAPTGKQLSLDLCKRLPNIRYIMQGYGMSEHGVSHMCPPLPLDTTKHGSVGPVTCNYEVKIVDTESGAELVGPHRTGEIVVRSPSIMLGYLNRPGQTKDMIDGDRWLHTGDIGYYDEDEYFYVVDRLKELIKVKGFQVAPAELEDVLLQQPAVADAAVVGVDDERAGELPLAFVVLRDTHRRTTANQLLAAVNGIVSDFKQLKEVRLVEQIPKSASGKILRRLIRDRLRQDPLAKL